MKKVLLILSLLFIFPLSIFAAGSVTVSKSSITLDDGGSTTFEVKATNSAGKVTISSSNTSIVTVDKSSEWLDNSSVKVTVKAKGTGSANVTVTVDAATYDMEVIKKTYTVSVKVNAPKSSNNNLSNLTVNGTKVSGFSASKTSYTLSNTDDNKISISAAAEDSKAKVSGTGDKTLKYGKNTFDVVVTAENGSKKTYKVIVTKNDNRNKNNDLSSLTVSGLTFDFNKNTTSYTLSAEHSIDKVEISAKAEDSKAKVSGTGSKTLKDGKNTFSVTVTAENESKKTYNIVINRKNANGTLGDLSSNNKIKSLSIKGYDIKFDTNTDKYYIEASKDVDKLDLEVTLADSKAKYDVLNNSGFNKSINEVTIKVTSEDGKEKEYKIEVLKKELVGFDTNKEDTKKDDAKKEDTKTTDTKKDNKWIIFLVIAIIELLFIIGYLIFTKMKSGNSSNQVNSTAATSANPNVFHTFEPTSTPVEQPSLEPDFTNLNMNNTTTKTDDQADIINIE